VDRIQQVLLNLLSNSRKFVPKQLGMILIDVDLPEWDGKTFLRVSVKDNGPGISAED
jgi:signal transduction histidine kinase